MYKNNIIVLIKKDGQPLRETDGRLVYLPFDSEYSIEIKNQSYRRAVASVKIDGTDVLGDEELIIPAYSTVPLERFIIDGNLDRGKKFKFVPLSNSKVQDPSSPKNGLIEIEVWFEKPVIRTLGWTTTTAGTWPRHNEWIGSSSNRMPFYSDSATLHANSINCYASVGESGATVEGNASNQSFTVGAFGEKEYPSTTFRIWLKSALQEVKSEDKLYCTNCGKKMRFDYKYCPRCGNPVQIA